MASYELAGGDGGSYGPQFGPIRARELGEIPGQDGGHILLALDTPLHIEGAVIEFLAIRPRYVGDTISTIRRKGATVGVWRVLPNCENSVRGGITQQNSEYWATVFAHQAASRAMS